MRSIARACALLGVTLLFALPTTADRLVTHDGRIIEVKKARKLPDGNYQLVFEAGEIVCPERFVASVEIEGDMSDYVPKNDDERDKLEKGFVRYRGKWLSKPAYEAELNRQAEESRERTEELAAHADFYDGWETETKHFIIKTNTSPELLEYYAELLETYYDLMDERVGIKPTPTLRRTKMKVNIYKNREEFTKLTKMPPGVAGYFSFLEESLNFYHDYPEPETSDWVGLHECTHLLTYLIQPQAAPSVSAIWMNEGMADYFGSSEITRDKRDRLQIEPGKVQVDRVLTVQQAIEDGTYVPLEKLLKLEKSGFSAFEYSHAWSFVYFLNTSSKKYQKAFEKFFDDFYTIAKGVDSEAVPYPNQQGMAKVIPKEEVRELLMSRLKVKDLEKLEAEWLDYISKIDVDAPQARFKRGLNTLRFEGAEGLESAQEDLDAAIEAGIEDPRAFWARGLIKTYRSKSGVKSGLDDFRKAVELAPLNAQYHYNLGQVLGGFELEGGPIKVTVGAGDELYGDAEELKEAYLHYGLAAELAPQNTEYSDGFSEFLALYQASEPEKEGAEGGSGQ